MDEDPATPDWNDVRCILVAALKQHVSPDDAEDLAQDALLRLCRCPPPKPVASWSGLARQAARFELGRHRRGRRRGPRFESLDTEPEDPGGTEHEERSDNGLRLRVLVAQRDWPPLQARVLSLVLAGVSDVRRISEQCDIPSPSIRDALRTIVRMLCRHQHEAADTAPLVSDRTGSTARRATAPGH